MPITSQAAVRSPVARIFLNVGQLVTGKAAAGLLSLVYLVIVTRVLGAQGYGVLVLVNAYALLLGSTLAFSGFHGVVRYGAIAIERGDKASLARIIRFMAVVELGCGAFAVAVAAIMAPIVGPRLGWSEQTIRFALPYSLAVLATVRATPQGILQLAGRFDLIAVHQTVSPIARMVGVAIAWAMSGGLIAYLGVWLFSALAEGLAMWLLSWQSWTRLVEGERVFGSWRGATRENAGLARFILTTNFDITLRELAPQLVPLTVGWMMGPAAAGLFALAQRATNVLQQPAVLLASGSYSVLADLAARGGGRPLRLAVWRSVGLSGLGSLIVLAALTVVGGKLLVWIGGSTFTGGTGLMLLIAVGRALVLTTTPLGAGLTAMGQPGKSVAAALVSNIVLYPLLPVLLLWLDVNGAGWHAIAQNMAAAIMLTFFFARVRDRRA
ncbi:lipopolysaccharide biosynthesis protein [Sphingomonas sp. MMS24-J13]|uniref:lipopolysaccharide biosynthesis protein n=1 Tax=Sphingomonas sp. MMS24-J13 TaxID=3238686 RepID=UPI00384E6F83